MSVFDIHFTKSMKCLDYDDQVALRQKISDYSLLTKPKMLAELIHEKLKSTAIDLDDYNFYVMSFDNINVSGLCIRNKSGYEVVTHNKVTHFEPSYDLSMTMLFFENRIEIPFCKWNLNFKELTKVTNKLHTDLICWFKDNIGYFDDTAEALISAEE